MSGAAPLVTFEHVDKTYDGRNWVVRDLSLAVDGGEFLTLLGPSGSGKTTTLMMLAGFETPERGRIMVDGRDVVPLPPHKREMGVVFQSYALFPHMTVGENVAFPLAARGIPSPERRRRVTEALQLVHLGEVSERRPRQLSGGQQQRIALARALVYRPRLILMDEPLGALDKGLRLQMQIEIKELHRQLGITFVYVTHDQEEALTMSDRVAIFHQGRIAQLGAPSDLYHRPHNRFVAGFLGETSFLPCRVVGRDGDLVVVELANGSKLRGVRSSERSSPPGGDAFAAIRPEHVRVLEAGSTEMPGDGRLPGVVRSAVFHGDHVALHVETGGGQVKATLWGENVPSAPAPGETVDLALPHRRTLILD